MNDVNSVDTSNSRWPARHLYGVAVASGVYMPRIEHGAVRRVRSIVLLK